MKTLSLRVLSLWVVFAILAGLLSAPEPSLAQAPAPQNVDEAAAIAPGALPIQGKLTSAAGAPLNGVHHMTFRLYEAETGGAPVCTDSLDVTVANGLFNTYMDHCYGGKLAGQKVYLGIQVDPDPEMTPRQVIFPVAYALGLVPGAVVNSDGVYDPLALSTSYGSGKALSVSATSSSGTNYAIYATNNSTDGYAGYFNNFSSGTGLSSTSTAGTAVYAGSLDTALRASGGLTAISAEGSGKIKSSAKSYVWISGNDVRPSLTTDSTRIEMDNVGGATIYRGATGGNKNVMLPITVTGPLYGQDVTISAVDIYWAGDTAFEGIAAVVMRRQTGVCGSSSCYVSIINDHPAVGYSCEDSLNPTGCTVHYAPTANNILTASSGILYLTIEMAYGGDTWVKIGGVRLTLEHD